MILVITGSIGSGKTTAAEFLVNEFGFEETSFAEPIKKFALALGFQEKEVYGTQEEKNQVNSEWGISGREFMQRFGTDIMRNHGKILNPEIENPWIKAVEIRLKNQKKNLVISDARFQDEVDMVKKNGGVVLKLVRDKNEFSSNHISEKGFQTIQSDFVYENTRTKEELFDFLKNNFGKENGH